MTGLLADKVKRLNEMLLDVNQEVKELVKLIVENIPEWERLLGLEQHDIHDYTLDVHTLLVLEKVREFEKFRNLKEENRLILLYAGLLHDIEKKEKEVDPSHPERGAVKSSQILYRLGFSEGFINSVYSLIKNHQLLGLIASDRMAFVPEDLASIYGDSLLLELQAMLSIADIKSVKKNEAFFNENMNKKIWEITEKTRLLMQNKNNY